MVVMVVEARKGRVMVGEVGRREGRGREGNWEGESELDELSFIYVRDK